MTIITTEEILKIAKISNIGIQKQEISIITEQLGDVIAYAHQVTRVAKDIKQASIKNINIWREDSIVQPDPKTILIQAPEHTEHFFVVPKIIEHN